MDAVYTRTKERGEKMKVTRRTDRGRRRVSECLEERHQKKEGERRAFEKKERLTHVLEERERGGAKLNRQTITHRQTDNYTD